MICANPKCGKEFEPRRWNQRFCRNQCCKNEFDARTKMETRQFLTRGMNYHCPVCDKDFIPNGRTGVGKGRIHQKCCSDVCSKKYYQWRHVDAPESQVKSCACCGEFIKVKKESRARKYCNNTCRNRSRNEAAKKKNGGSRPRSEKEKQRHREYKKTITGIAKAKLHYDNHIDRKRDEGLKRYRDARANLKDRYLKALIREQNGVKSNAISLEMIEQKRLQIQITRQIYEKQRTIKSSGNHGLPK